MLDSKQVASEVVRIIFFYLLMNKSVLNIKIHHLFTIICTMMINTNKLHKTLKKTDIIFFSLKYNSHLHKMNCFPVK